MWLVLLSSGIFWKQLAWKNRIPGFHLLVHYQLLDFVGFLLFSNNAKGVRVPHAIHEVPEYKSILASMQSHIINVFVYGHHSYGHHNCDQLLTRFSNVYHLCNCSVVLACKSIALIQGCCRSAHLLRYSHTRPGPYRLLAREIQHTHTVRRPPRPRTRTLYSETNN